MQLTTDYIRLSCSLITQSIYQRFFLPSPYQTQPMTKKLYRSKNDRVLAGVCAGLANHFNVDPVLIRVIFVAALLGGGFGLLAYLILWVVTPENPEFYQANEQGSTYTNDISYKNQDKMSNNNRAGSTIAGVILILLGGLFLAEEFLPDFDFEKYWPLILIFVGVGLLFGGINTKSSKS